MGPMRTEERTEKKYDCRYPQTKFEHNRENFLKCLIFLKKLKKLTIFVKFKNKNAVVGSAWGVSIRITHFRPLRSLEQES